MSPYAVGRALHRIMSNNGLSDGNNIAEIVRGFCS